MLALVSREDNNSLILGWAMVGGHTDIALHILGVANAEPITDNIILCDILYANMHTTLRHHYTVPILYYCSVCCYRTAPQNRWVT